MATFKVGQRVKKIRRRLPCEPFYAPDASSAPVGSQGTVTGFVGTEVEVLYDFDGAKWLVMAGMLAPLTDPGADAFLESIRKLKPLDKLADHPGLARLVKERA